MARPRRRRAPGTVAVLGALIAAAAAGATDWFVDDDGPADFPSIQAAIDAPYVHTGDTIRVRPGIYRGTVYLSSKDLVIRSESGPFATIVDAEGAGAVVSLVGRTAATRIEGFTLRNGEDATGGGVWIFGGGPVVTRNVIEGNRAVGGYLGYGYGGGIEVYGSAAVITRNLIRDNTALDGGGGIDVYESGPSTPGTCCPVISQNTILDNRVTSPAGMGGGVLVSASEPRLASSIVAGNVAARGGGLYVERAAGNPDGPEVTTNIFFSNAPGNSDGDGGFHLPPSNDLVDPRLGPGEKLRYWPRSDSPAIDRAEGGLPPGPDLTGATSEIDGDLDGAPAGDVGAVESRGEITGLGLSSGVGGLTTLASWDDSVNASVVFDLYLSDGDPFVAGGGLCLAGNLEVASYADDLPLPPGGIRFYLVGGRGVAVGTLGLRSDGSTRPGPVGCPGP